LPVSSNSMMNSGLSEPLAAQTSGSDAGSAHSQRSGSAGGSSLLERIQMQRQREAAMQQQQQSTPQQIQVPNYADTTSNMPGFGSSPNNESNSNFFSSAWSNLSQSMETGAAADQQHEMESALLAPASQHGSGLDLDENYSMQSYFMTFVKDVYGLFLRLPVPARVVAVVGLLYIALKLL